MILQKTVFLGTYPSIEAVWAKYPAGGIEGEYVVVDGVEYGWNKYDRIWDVIDENGNTAGAGTSTGGGSGTGTSGGTGSTGVPTNGGSTTKDDCCGCHQVVNVYGGGCCDGNSGSLIDLAITVGRTSAEIESLKEKIEQCGGTSGTEGCTNCRPMRIELTPEDFCEVQLTYAEAVEQGIVIDTPRDSEMESDGDNQSQSESESDNQSQSDPLPTSTTTLQQPYVRTLFSAPDGIIEEKLIGVYIEGLLSESAKANNTGNSSGVLRPLLG